MGLSHELQLLWRAMVWRNQWLHDTMQPEQSVSYTVEAQQKSMQLS
jgi:hypothetical protein